MASRKKAKKKPARAKSATRRTAKIRAEGSTKITPFLMYKDKCVEAANFYISIFKQSRILSADAMSASFILNGQKFYAFNGGPHFSFSEGISLFVSCETQREVDYYWSKLTADGGSESMCGWLRDKYGVSWQIIPAALSKLLRDKDRSKASRALQAMLKMKKINIHELKTAAKG